MRRTILTWLGELLGEPGLQFLAVSSVHFVALAFLIAATLGVWRARRANLSLKVTLLAIGAAGFGALWWGNWVALAFNPERVQANPMTLVILIEGGFSSIGAYAGASSCMVWTLRRFKQPFWPYADAMAPGLMVAAAVARLGCFWAGCDFGRLAVGLPWAVRYPRGTAAFRYLDEIGMVGGYQRVGLPMHPFPLYEALPVLALGLALLWRPRLLGSVTGQLTSGCAVIYCFVRMVAETFRADTPLMLGQVSVLQGLCAVGIVLFGTLWWRLRSVERVGGAGEDGGGRDEAQDGMDGGSDPAGERDRRDARA